MGQYEEHIEDFNSPDCVMCGAMIPEGSDCCPECGWTWKMLDASDDNFDGADCVVCGTAIPPACDRCPHCGWTWKRLGTVSPVADDKELDRPVDPESHARPIDPQPPRPVKYQKPSLEPSRAAGPDPAVIVVGLILCSTIVWLIFQ